MRRIVDRSAVATGEDEELDRIREEPEASEHDRILLRQVRETDPRAEEEFSALLICSAPMVMSS